MGLSHLVTNSPLRLLRRVLRRPSVAFGLKELRAFVALSWWLIHEDPDGGDGPSGSLPSPRLPALTPFTVGGAGIGTCLNSRDARPVGQGRIVLHLGLPARLPRTVRE